MTRGTVVQVVALGGLTLGLGYLVVSSAPPCAYAAERSRSNDAPIVSVSCSAPSRPPRRASSSDSFVKPETSMNTHVPSSTRDRRSGVSVRWRSRTRGRYAAPVVPPMRS